MTYDYVVQMKLPGEGYVNMDWPEGRHLPKIQWKVKEYLS